MTKEEIKKALEFCGAINSPCANCPYKNVENCYNTLKIDALNLIIEQENEIEQLKDGYARVQEQFAQYQMASDKEIAAQVKQAQIDVLNKAKERCDLVAEELEEDECDHYGSSAAYSCAYEIKKIINEVESDK